jgi:hypothetical protein
MPAFAYHQSAQAMDGATPFTLQKTKAPENQKAFKAFHKNSLDTINHKKEIDRTKLKSFLKENLRALTTNNQSTIDEGKIGIALAKDRLNDLLMQGLLEQEDTINLLLLIAKSIENDDIDSALKTILDKAAPNNKVKTDQPIKANKNTTTEHLEVIDVITSILNMQSREAVSLKQGAKKTHPSPDTTKKSVLETIFKSPDAKTSKSTLSSTNKDPVLNAPQHKKTMKHLLKLFSTLSE